MLDAMQIQNFRDEVRLDQIIEVNREPHRVVAMVEWKGGGLGFTAVYLEDEWVLIADPAKMSFFFGKATHAPFRPPFSEQLFFQGRTYVKVEHEDLEVKELFGSSLLTVGTDVAVEVFRSEDGSVLRLQRRSDGSVYDVVGKMVPLDWIHIV